MFFCLPNNVTIRLFFFFSSRRRHTRFSRDWSSDVCSSDLGRDHVVAYESELLAYGTERLSSLPGVRLIGTAREKAGVLSFVVDGVHAHDVGTILGREGIAVRAGHHCAMPVLARLRVPP